MSMISSIEAKLGPCPRCGGRAMVDSYSETPPSSMDIDVRCTKCGLTMEYDYDAFYDPFPARITWSVDLKNALSVADAWRAWNDAQVED